MCRNDAIGQAQKTLGDESGHFQTVEALPTHIAPESACVLAPVAGGWAIW